MASTSVSIPLNIRKSLDGHPMFISGVEDIRNKTINQPAATVPASRTKTLQGGQRTCKDKPLIIYTHMYVYIYAYYYIVPYGCIQVHIIFIICIYVYIHHRRKFRSQTSDNMDRWKAEQGRGREKRKIRRKKSRRERVRRKKMQMREKVGKSRFTVCFQ